MQEVFDFTDYRSYLNVILPVKGAGRGQRAKLAQALNCRSGFVSLVLGGNAQFSLEHAMIISRFLEHSEEEQEYFLLLVHLDRAGSKDLELYYKNKIEKIYLQRREIKERINVKTGFSEKDQMIYYSSWHYLGIHMAIFSSELQSRQALAKYFNLSMAKVTQVVSFLMELGLVTEEAGWLKAFPSRTHLSSDSPMIAKHHTNWRIKAIQSLDEPNNNDLHYSAVYSISENAAQKLRDIILKSLKEMEPVIKEAKDEAVYILSTDLFLLK